MAYIATGNHDEALDIVQDAMLKLVQKYADKPNEEWPPLFIRILQSRIKDWYRRNQVRSKWRVFLKRDSDEEEMNRLEQLAVDTTLEPARTAKNQQAIEQLDVAIRMLPLRQQQAFMLRVWEGLNEAETAEAMGCSKGSVKTHYSRAIHTLREKLEGVWP